MIRLANDIAGLEICDIFEEGGWVIRPGKIGVWELYEIPLYGGEEIFVREFTNDALDEAIAWAKGNLR